MSDEPVSISSELAIRHMQMETMRCIVVEAAHSPKHAERYVAGMLLGCVEFLKSSRGSREAYKIVSDLADTIIEDQLTKGR